MAELDVDSLMERFTKQREPLSERMFSDMLNFLSSDTQLKKFTVLKDATEVRAVMKMLICNELFYKKYVSQYMLSPNGESIKDNKGNPVPNPDYIRYDGLISNYMELLISSNNGRGRKDIVNMFTGGAAKEEHSGLRGVLDKVGGLFSPKPRLQQMNEG